MLRFVDKVTVCTVPHNLCDFLAPEQSNKKSTKQKEQ